MTIKLSRNGRMAAAAGVVVLVAGGAYLVGRVYPPMGAGTNGTIQPPERYRSSQIQGSDVGLGDTSVTALMQTDAFEVMVKNPGFRTMAKDPAFMSFAQNNPAAISAIAANPQAFAELNKN